MIRTADDYAAARMELGLSIRQLATVLRLGANGYRAVQRYEDGVRDIPGPQAVAIEAMLAGFRPAGWPE